MTRPLLDENHLHPAVRERISRDGAEIIGAVQAAVAAHRVVVVGMSMNPFVKRARQALDAAGIAHHDIDYGGYHSQWRQRLMLKMWTGWPTFPMVFVRGVLVGGADDVRALIARGELGPHAG